ncbi:MAG: gluconokinase [Ardenticatenaceae bacterium]
MATIIANKAVFPLVLTLDVGSSSIRTLLFDGLGRAVEGSLAVEGHCFESRAAGASVAAAEGLLERLFRCIDQTLAHCASVAGQIGAVACCTFVNNVCGVDEGGQVVVPLTTYADTRSAVEVAGLRADFEEAVLYQRTGCRFHPSYLPARLRWLARAEADSVARVRRWLSFGEYLELKLFGEAAVSYSVASWSGLLNRHTLAWDEELIAQLPIESAQLYPLTDFGQPLQGLRTEFASRWAALRDIPWFRTIGDGAAANIGSGCVSDQEVALTIGTTSALRVVIEDEVPPVPDGLWCYRVDGRRSLLGGALSEGGNLFSWMKSRLQLDEIDDLNERLSALEPDQHGLTILPFLAGERSPGWAGEARATIHGLTLATTPLQMLQAGLESVAYRLAQVFDLLQGQLTSQPHLITSGGALRHASAWAQLISDVLGRPLLVSDVSEASSRGVALLALEALGTVRHLSELPVDIVTRYEPHQKRYQRYQEAIARQKELYHLLV